MTEQKGPCPACPSSDGFVTFANGSQHCFSCGHHVNNGQHQGGDTKDEEDEDGEPLKLPGDLTTEEIKERKIPQLVCEQYGVLQDSSGRRYYQYYSGGKLTSLKVKNEGGEPKFSIKGRHKKVQLFGSHVHPPGSSQHLVITEGEDDTLASTVMLGRGVAVTSLPNGSSSCKAALTDNIDYINSFKYVYICFDADKPGREAVDVALKLLPMHKTKVMDLTHGEYKDACDYLKGGDATTFTKVFNQAEYPKPKGIVSGREAWEEAIDRAPVTAEVQYPWDCVNNKTYGLRLGEVVLLTAQSGVGKSYVLNETLYKVLSDTNYNVGAIGQEEDEADMGKRMMSIKLNKPTHFKHIRDTISKDEWDKGKHELPLDRLHGHYEVSGLDCDEILGMIQYMVQGLGCKFIFYDHISMAVSEHKQMDERKALDRLSTRIKALAKKLGFCCVIVSHLNREGEVKGSANPEKVADTWIDLRRDMETGDNITSLVIRKNRFVGPTGPAGSLYFDMDTYRITEWVGETEDG